MSIWTVRQIILEVHALAAIAVGISGPKLGYWWAAPFAYYGWCVLGVVLGILLARIWPEYFCR